jgi:NAD(P)-dependent dehydrogenase (short-subunit alcohol dehydrogenase family)
MEAAGARLEMTVEQQEETAWWHHRGQPGPDPGRAASIARRRTPAQTTRHAAATAFLASDEADWITGVVVDVAGCGVLA